MKIRILEDHDHWPTPAFTQAFKAGTEPDVPRKTADALIKLGKAEPITRKATQEE